MDAPPKNRRTRMAGAIAAGTVLAGGLVLGAVGIANAQGTSSTPSAPSQGSGTPGSGMPGYGTPGSGQDRGQPPQGGTRDESQSQRPDEHLLTGDDATKVRDAALAKYPGATIQRVETDSDGVYEAHLTTTDGKRVTVEVGKDFAVTGEEAPPAHN